MYKFELNNLFEDLNKQIINMDIYARVRILELITGISQTGSSEEHQIAIRYLDAKVKFGFSKLPSELNPNTWNLPSSR